MSRSKYLAFLMACLVRGYAQPAFAQDQVNLPARPNVSAARPANGPKLNDVGSPDAIIAAANDVISGPAGQKRDWDRMLALFYPGAQLIRTARSEGGGMNAAFFSPEEYMKRADRYFKENGFWEKEISRRSEGWANILQVFSTYESRHDVRDAAPFARGINSYQLLYDGQRWWILTIYWQEETLEKPIPAKYLGRSH